MAVRIEDVDSLLGEVFDDGRSTAGWINGGNLQQNEERSIIASTIALHGAKAVADGDIEYITALLHRAAELTLTDPNLPIIRFLEICNEDGYNLLHATVIHKKLEIMELLFEYGTNIIDTPTKDKYQDTPLILAIKNFAIFLNPPPKIRSSSAACLSVSVQVVQNLLAIGASVNAENARGDTPLILACKIQNLDLVKRICKHANIKVNKKNNLGKSALHYAAAFNNTELALVLLDCNASITEEDIDGFTPVHTACKYGREEVLYLMLERQRESIVDIMCMATNDGKTPLLIAKSAINFSSNIIDFLISQGSRLSAVDKHKNSLLHVYTTHDDVGLHERILEAEPSLLKARNFDLETPLHIAASYGLKETCVFYMERGADYKARDINNSIPIMRAIMCGHQSVIKTILEFGCEVTMPIKHHKTLLEWAIENEYNVLIEAMCEFYTENAMYHPTCSWSDVINVAAKTGQVSTLGLMLELNTVKHFASFDKECSYALTTAVKQGHLNCVKLLYEQKSGLTSSDNGTDTPLHIACRCGHFELVKYLLSQGADSEICNSTEGTAVACAAANGHEHIVSYLINNGASTTGGYYKSDLKTTPLILASRNGHSGVVKVLLQYEVEINLKSSNGLNCLCEAILNGHRSTVLTILRSTNWKDAMRFRTEANITPMRMMIKHMPDVAEVALFKCITPDYSVNEMGHRKLNHITYSFEFLDDFTAPHKNVRSYVAGAMTQMGLVRSGSYSQRSVTVDSGVYMLMPTDKDMINSDTSTRIKNSQQEGYDDWMIKDYDIKNHVLNLMVQHKRISLLKHPVVSELLKFKWNKFGLPVFILNFVLYALFVVLLTTLVGLTPLPQRNQCREDYNTNKDHNGSNGTDKYCEGTHITGLLQGFVKNACRVVIIVSVILFIFNMLKLIRRKRTFILDIASWTEVLFSVSSALFAIFYLHTYKAHQCDCISNGTWRIGVVAVFSGWCSLTARLSKFPVTGIIINMMLSIIYTFISLLPIALLLCFTFALPFYMILAQPGRRTAFSDLGRSLLKTLVMTTGEFEFDTIYINEQDDVDKGISLEFPVETTIFWVIFVIMMPILFSNLLVGLAVGDTQEELNKAELTKYTLRIQTILGLEEAFPMLRIYSRISEQTLYDGCHWYDWVRGSKKLERREAHIDGWKNREDIDQLLEGDDETDPLEKIEGRLTAMCNEHSERLSRMETLLCNLVRLSESSQVTPDTQRDNSSSSSSSSNNNNSSNTAMRKRALTLEAALSVKRSSYMQQQFFCTIVDEEENN